MSNVNSPPVVYTEEQLKSYHLGHQAGVAHHKQATEHLRLKNTELQSALDAMQASLKYETECVAAISAERDALQAKLTELQKQEPAGHFVSDFSEPGHWHQCKRAIEKLTQPLYASPKALEPLTDEQIDELVGAAFDDHAYRGTRVMSQMLARAIEAAHGIGSQQS